MPYANTTHSYGAIAKGFHWLTALLILTIIPLGLIANDLAHAVRNPDIATTEADTARAALLFSLHKTLGVAIFFVALLRILWAIIQPHPKLLNGDKPAEAWLASTIHWLLYGSLVLVPLTGWVHHAATSGFAPIWWPFGQSLPFVPKDEGVAEISGTLHYILQWVLICAITLHVLGALKHHVIDRDATLRRMLPGHTTANPTDRQPGHALPFVTALAVWAAAIGGGAAIGLFSHGPAQATGPALAAVESDWQVQEGTLDISVSQMGSDVSGTFSDWTAEIAYSEESDAEGKHGDVTVTVSIPSLTLGSVTDQAMGPDYFDAETHPTATFDADILAEGDSHVADGTLTIKDQSVPVTLPFTLAIDGDTASANGTLSVDRRDFNIGLGTKDEGTLGFTVDITFDLTANRP
ncbi:cytochrome b/b6 domain-containing protein [Roseovarius sp.]|uniref:cytochrome b/b6 domain-containing protein n=1 Tax=Roseovarius sp. TaxID=1486281 RepID=UPI002634AA89|nr:cytochrome b/b6 domain-containing protein [Roseovarius sp.]MDM8165331.1 cytochrome b/b6 domain-containing protein [Roseovarius sp.]